MTEALDTTELVRKRLADGRTIADADVHRLVAEIDRLRAEESTCSTACIAERQAAGFCGEAEEAHAEIARLRGVLNSIARNTCCDQCQEAALVAREALAHPR